MFKFVHEHHDLLIRNQRTWFGSPILKGVQEERFTKLKQSGKKAELNKEILAAKIKYVRGHICNWPSSYERGNELDEPISGEAILSELDGVVDIFGHHLIRLHDADNYNKENLNRES